LKEPLSVQKIEDNINYYSYQHAHYKKGDNGKIDRKTVFLYKYITGQLAEKRYMLAENKY
jgi:hypothetical protein